MLFVHTESDNEPRHGWQGNSRGTDVHLTIDVSEWPHGC